jgi:Bifunctional DNA primase/polymerase, N-terminal/Protein of unknown function (DUF3987)
MSITPPRAVVKTVAATAAHSGDGVDLYRAVVEAWAAQLNPVPVKEDGSKAPDCGLWAERQKRRTTEQELANWFDPAARRRRHGVGTICGKVSGNLEVLEFDAGGESYQAFKSMADALGLGDLVERIEAGYAEQSPSGGIHWLYRCEVVEGNTKLASRPKTEAELTDSDRATIAEKEAKGETYTPVKTLIETRGEGGFIVLAPSAGPVHPTGRPYVLLRGAPATIATITAEERADLWALARAFDHPVAQELPPATAPKSPKSRSELPPDWQDIVSPIDDYCARKLWSDILPHGWTLAYRHGDTEYWRRPDKDRGHSATIGRGGADRLYVFSSSTAFETNKPYSKFDAYARLNHGGNDKAAVKSLAQDGYGTHKRWIKEDGEWVLRGPFPNPVPSKFQTGERLAVPGEPPPSTGRGRIAVTESGFSTRSVNGTGHHAELIPTESRNGDGQHAEPANTAEPDPEETPIIDQWPTIDYAMFHGLPGEFVARIDPETEADPVATLIQLLVAFGSMIGRRAHFRVGASKHYLNLFCSLVGATAVGRKGTSWDFVRWVLGIVDYSWEQDCIQSGLVSGEGLIHAVRDQVIKEEKVVDEGVTDKRLLVVETELSRPLKAMNRESNTLSDVVRQAWDSGYLRTMSKHNGTRASNAHISIVAHTTRADVVQHLAAVDSANGFANRFLWVAVRRSKLLPEGGRVTEAGLGDLPARLARVAAIARGEGEGGGIWEMTVGGEVPAAPLEMRRDDAARALWAEVYPRLSAGKPGLLGAVLSRAEAQTMRLACLYALLDGSAVVGVEHLRAALALWSYCEASARFVFGESHGDPDTDKVLDALKAATNGLTRKEIYVDVFKKNKASDKITDLLTCLLTQGLVHAQTESSGKGRPAQRWRLGPAS